jgi:hypothetical protein
MGNSVKGNGLLACCMLMMAYEADGAIVVVGCGIVVMKHRRERGQQENKDKKSCKAFGPAHGAPFARWFQIKPCC